MLRLRVLLLLALSVPVITRAADTNEIGWHSVPSAAAAIARAQGKMLLVYYRGDCDTCNDGAERMFAAAAKDEVFHRTLESLLPLRIDAKSASHPVVDSIRKAGKGPFVAIYDTEGVQLALVRSDDLQWNKIGELLLRFRGARNYIAAANVFRARGDKAGAAYALGDALVAAREPRRAAEQYDIAADAFKGRSEQNRQFAQLLAAYARFGAGLHKRAKSEISIVLRDAVSDAVKAEAHFRLGAIAEAGVNERITIANTQPISPSTRALPQTPVTQQSTVIKNSQALRSAVTSYRKAYDLAAPGSITLEAARRALARVDDRPLPSKEGMPSTIRLIVPPRPALTGETEFVAETGPGVARVDFFLDDRQVASQRKTPFRATIDLGPTATARNVKARAFDAEGKPLGDAVVPINDRLDAFVVTITSPVSDTLRGDADVALDVRVPPGRALVNVELSWNGEPFATLTGPPYRARLKGTGDVGYLRVLGTLDNGATAEATKLFNAAVAANVDVASVTLIASVSDDDGKRVRGLRSQDFVIADEGKQVTPELRSSEEDPVTIGIAVDSSASMAGKQLYVIRAAAEFLGRALRPQDEAFVVSFDTDARLVHQRSRNTASLRSSVLDLVPAGGTSIFDGVTFALQQLQGIPGKRALLVFSDGREGTSSASARECGRLARALGVPIYLIVPPGGEKSKHALADVAEATGGTMLYATPVDKFGEMSDRLADEVRGQYVLSFTRPAGVKAGEWRSVRVDVKGRDANVRAVQGYRVN